MSCRVKVKEEDLLSKVVNELKVSLPDAHVEPVESVEQEIAVNVNNTEYRVDLETGEISFKPALPSCDELKYNLEDVFADAADVEHGEIDLQNPNELDDYIETVDSAIKYLEAVKKGLEKQRKEAEIVFKTLKKILSGEI